MYTVFIILILIYYLLIIRVIFIYLVWIILIIVIFFVVSHKQYFRYLEDYFDYINKKYGKKDSYLWPIVMPINDWCNSF